MAEGVGIEAACRMAIVLPLTDDEDVRDALMQAVSACI